MLISRSAPFRFQESYLLKLFCRRAESLLPGNKKRDPLLSVATRSEGCIRSLPARLYMFNILLFCSIWWRELVELRDTMEVTGLLASFLLPFPPADDIRFNYSFDCMVNKFCVAVIVSPPELWRHSTNAEEMICLNYSTFISA